VSIPAANAVAGTAAAEGRKTNIAGDFDTFLRLLTTQLANQDPLSPMDSNQFTEQLVQFASVEQSVAMNDKLEAIQTSLAADRFGAGAGYLGRAIEARVSTLRLGRTGTASFAMNVAEQPAQLAVNVKNASGKTIAQLLPPPAAGAQTVVWDGRDKDGLRAPAGTYHVEVAAADAAGTPIPVSTHLSGIVDAVESEDGTLFLDVAGHRVALSDVTAVRLPASNDEGASS